MLLLQLCFYSLTPSARSLLPSASSSRSMNNSSPSTSSASFNSVSRDGRIQLQIVRQPEQQHRARYQTEGSRGAVKDRSGSGFPIVKVSCICVLKFREIFVFDILKYNLVYRIFLNR